jgi:hypothetical protein
VSPGYPNTPEKQDSDLKSYIMMLVEDFKNGINNSFKEIQNTAKKVELMICLKGQRWKESCENRTWEAVEVLMTSLDIPNGFFLLLLLLFCFFGFFFFFFFLLLCYCERCFADFFPHSVCHMYIQVVQGFVCVC